MPSAVKKYGFINAKLRACLSNRITPEQLKRITQSSDVTEALQVLQNTDYHSAFETYHETGDIKMVERELISMEIDSIGHLKRYVGPEIDHIIDAFLEKYETDRVKDAIRYWFDRTVRNRFVDDHMAYMLKSRILADIDYTGIVYAEDDSALLELLQGTVYYPPVKEHLHAVKEKGTLFDLESALDSAYFERMMRTLERLKGRDKAVAATIMGIQIDMENISRLSKTVRFLQDAEIDPDSRFISGGRSINIQELKRAMSADDPKEFLQASVAAYYGSSGLLRSGKSDRGDTFFIMLLALLEEIFISEVMKLLYGYPFTIGIVLAYCYIKQNELKKITRLLNAKYYNMDEKRMMELI